MIDSPIFTPCQIGPITLRNRTIRSAAFENMAFNNSPSQMLFDYHTAVARGGVGMTTVAYASVSQSGLSFHNQLWLREEVIPELKKLTDAVHAEGAKASIQIGHCGNMTHRDTCGEKPVSASGNFNLYSPTFTRMLTVQDIDQLVDDFGKAVDMCRRAGFDCIEVHAGHGYLISQFLSPYTNRRKDEYGGSLENRMRFMRRVITRVMEEAKDDMAVVVKTNMYDGFSTGMQVDECIKVAQELEKLGVHALVLTAGFVSKAPMEVMRGSMPMKTLTYYMDMKEFWWLKLGLRLGGRWMIPTVPYKDAYFYDTAMKFRQAVKMPLIYVGGMVNKDDMEMVLNSGFVAFQMARALVHDTDFVNKLHSGEVTKSGCKHSNYCIGRMYTLEMKCHQCMKEGELPTKLQREIEKSEAEVEKKKGPHSISSLIVLIISSLLLSFGSLSAQSPNKHYQQNKTKMDQLLNAINTMYVDSVDFDPLLDKSINEMLKELDPHTAYIPSKDVQAMTEPLQGSFDGIGVTFQLIKDTINVMEVIIDGPSEKVGLMAGDKIVMVDDTVAVGEKITNDWVRKHLRGKKGTKVKVTVVRGRKKEPIDFVITRGAIPMYSINVSFMADSITGYVKLERFAATSTTELKKAITKLKEQGMQNLILDLRGNGGGYLNVAFEICDQFISGRRMIVYTDNFRKTGEKYYSSEEGLFEDGKLIVLVDENSASASEITSGCIQDWDRGLVIGRRTFGKGLVQKPLRLIDQSEVRLTISHYYTPTGRCIQKPYNDGLDSYFKDLQTRAKNGEYYTADNIKFPDSLKFKTPHGRVVYGGGGIMPDIFIPLDTTKYSTLFNEIVRKGVFGNFTVDYLEKNRESLQKQYPTFEDFQKKYQISPEFYQEFMDFAKSEGVSDKASFVFSDYANAFIKENKGKLDSLYKNAEDFNQQTFDTMFSNYINKTYAEMQHLRNEEHAAEFIKEYLRFEIARGLYGYGDAYRVFLESDDTYQQAVEIMHNKKIFRKYKVNSGK